MTIDEAIKIKEQALRDNHPFHSEKLDEADRLSIEALLKWKEYRASDYSWWGNPLPGETEE